MNKEYLSIIEKSREKVFLIAENGAINFASTAIIEQYGFSADEYLLLNIQQIIHPEDLQHARVLMRQVLAASGKSAEFRLRNQDNRGNYRWIEGRLTNLLEDQTMRCLICHFYDIDKRINEEKEQALLIRDLTKRNLDLNQFVYIISHNLRTPLSNLVGLIAILDTDYLTEHNRKIVDLFQTSTESLNETITDLTQVLNRKNNQRVQTSNIDVQHTLNKVCSSFADQIKNLPILLHYDFKHSHIQFNISYLESILNNLLSNAIKYRDQHRTLEISVSLETDEKGRKVLSFSDNGLGINLDANKDELFGLHKRFHTHVNGNGVGLFITKSQITSLGGKIEVSSKVDEGTKFIITFCEEQNNQDI